MGKDSRPGLLDKKSRLKMLRKLNLSGTEISDVGLRYVTQFLAQLQNLSVSGCWKITDAGLAQLSTAEAKTIESLTQLNISSCKPITNVGLGHLSKSRTSSTSTVCKRASPWMRCGSLWRRAQNG